ncbi:MAG: hypothetical protein QGG36_13445 [Pirellulaceae bacterium]|jgi:predicted transcriptional regulator|nr:hypothetical protein [Pirellulaceae bacterium]
MTDSPTTGVKDAVSAIIQSLPDDVSWDELQYHLYVRQQIEAGLADSDAGRLIGSDEMRQRLIQKKS